MVDGTSVYANINAPYNPLKTLGDVAAIKNALLEGDNLRDKNPLIRAQAQYQQSLADKTASANVASAIIAKHWTPNGIDTNAANNELSSTPGAVASYLDIQPKLNELNAAKEVYDDQGNPGLISAQRLSSNLSPAESPNATGSSTQGANPPPSQKDIDDLHSYLDDTGSNLQNLVDKPDLNFNDFIKLGSDQITQNALNPKIGLPSNVVAQHLSAINPNGTPQDLRSNAQHYLDQIRVNRATLLNQGLIPSSSQNIVPVPAADKNDPIWNAAIQKANTLSPQIVPDDNQGQSQEQPQVPTPTNKQDASGAIRNGPGMGYKEQVSNVVANQKTIDDEAKAAVAAKPALQHIYDLSVNGTKTGTGAEQVNRIYGGLVALGAADPKITDANEQLTKMAKYIEQNVQGQGASERTNQGLSQLKSGNVSLTQAPKILQDLTISALAQNQLAVAKQSAYRNVVGTKTAPDLNQKFNNDWTNNTDQRVMELFLHPADNRSGYLTGIPASEKAALRKSAQYLQSVGALPQ